MGDPFNSEVFCARLDERMANVDKSLRGIRRGVHDFRNTVDTTNLQTAERMRRVETQQAKVGWIYPLIVSAITTLVGGVIIRALDHLMRH